MTNDFFAVLLVKVSMSFYFLSRFQRLYNHSKICDLTTMTEMASEDFTALFSSLLSSLRGQRQRDGTVTNIDENILLGLCPI